MYLSPRVAALAMCGVLLGAIGPALAAQRRPVPVTFEADVRPILKAYCFDCHGGEEKLDGKLDLRLKRFIVQGGNSGPAIVPRRPAQSLLLRRVQAGHMPPVGKKVPPESIEVLVKWIAAGAPSRPDEPEHLPPGIYITPEERAYWFYQPVTRPAPPRFRPADRVRTPIDAFVLARLRKAGVRTFAPDADPLTLIRRASIDLTGLPPTPAEVEAFVSDPSDAAYEKLLDRLLASPHYGERWGRHWLDVAGYADSDGNGNDDTPRPYAYKYRDYVIRALNSGKPMNEFLIEQLAGDELVPRPWTNLQPDQIDKLAATGFLRTAADTTADNDNPAAKHQVVADSISIVSSSLLGLTVACAQCHDHRYDPIPQADYYRIRAVLEPGLDTENWRPPARRLLSLYTEEDRQRAGAVEAEAEMLRAAFREKQAEYVAAALEKELEKFPVEVRDALRAAVRAPAAERTEEQKALIAANPSLLITPGVLYQYNQKAADELTAEQGKINAKLGERPPEDFISILSEEPGQVPVTHLFYRGDYRQPEQAIAPGDLTIASPEGRRFEIPENDPNLSTTGRRLAWARHLVDGKHPLVGRVLMNRVWLNHFGRGIVDTPGDFGKLGVEPTHPELLDWLADELVREDWHLKRLHKTIMLSTVYRQSSAADARRRAADSDGSLFSRYPVRRLDAETLRDRMLEAAGRLDRAQFGPPVPVVEDAVGQISAKDDSPRRSIYLQARRSQPISFLVAFDAPVVTVNCDRRIASNSAPQALMLMNSDFVLAQAKHFAERVRKEAPDDPARQVDLAWRIAYNRPAMSEERDLALPFLRHQQELHLKAQAEQAAAAAAKAAAEKPEAEKTEPTDAEKAEAARAEAQKAALAALTNLCQQLLSSNEFLYVD
jgi:hypothetical protein